MFREVTAHNFDFATAGFAHIEIELDSSQEAQRPGREERYARKVADLIISWEGVKAIESLFSTTYSSAMSREDRVNHQDKVKNTAIVRNRIKN